MSLASRVASAILGFISALLDILTPVTLAFLFIEMARYERDIFRITESQIEAVAFIMGAVVGRALRFIMTIRG